MTDEEPGQLSVHRHARLSRYEGRVGLELVTVIDFVVQGDILMITHTGTDPQWRGRGYAGRTTRAMLDDIRARGAKVQPLCPFTVAFFEAHPEYADLRG
jgi:predicted GNAT family acetyltransferase